MGAARPRALLGIALTALVLGASACSSSGKDPAKFTKREQLGLYLENALYYIEMGDIDRAQFQAERALSIDPGNERFELIYARANLMRGDAQSIENALAVLEKRPGIKDYRWQMTFGAALERKGVLYDEAARGVRQGERATRASDREGRAQELQAEAEGLWRRGRTHFERSLEAFPGEVEALNGLVRTNALLGDFEGSVRWAYELVAGIRESQYLTRSQLEAPDITAEREARLRNVLRKNREFEVRARLHIATLQRRLDRAPEAIRELDEVIELQPELAQPHSLRGQLLMETGDYVKARAALTRFLSETDLPFDDAQVRRTFDLIDECDQHLRAQG